MMRPEVLLAPDPVAIAVFARVVGLLGDGMAGSADVTVRATRSQVAFRRARGFAWLWRPAQYLRRSTVPVVLSVALGRQDASPRWKEVVHPSPRHWIHHLEVRDVSEIDDEVAGWLLEAAARAGRGGLPHAGEESGGKSAPAQGHRRRAVRPRG